VAALTPGGRFHAAAAGSLVAQGDADLLDR